MTKASATGSTQRVSGTTPLNLVNQGSMPCAVPLVIQPAISGPVVTASFQRCSSSGPIEVMRITGRSRKVARTRLPLRPAIHSDSAPRRPWSSTTMNGQCFSMSLRSNSISEAPLMLGMKLACGRIAFTSIVPGDDHLCQHVAAPLRPGLPDRIVRIGDLRERRGRVALAKRSVQEAQ